MFGACNGILDQGRGLLGGFGAACREIADLFGNHGKALAVLTGPCRLHCGVKRQQVGLKGDLVDGFDDLRDAVL